MDTPTPAALPPCPASRFRPELFIYFRVGTENDSAVCAAVNAFQADLRASYPGLIARLLRRPESDDGRSTFMEVYALPAAADGGEHGQPDLAAAIEAAAKAALAPWILGKRQVEMFSPCA